MLYAAGLIFFSFLYNINSYGQNVAISATGASPAVSAMLDVQSTSAGFLVPRMTNAQKLAIGAPAEALLVYVTDVGANQGYWYYEGGWKQLGSGSGWNLTGNASTTASTSAIGVAANNNFVGTTDAHDFVLAANNYERMRITSGGLIGIDNISPSTCSILDMSKVTTLGVLIPNVSIANTGTFTISGAAADGVLIYNTNGSIAGTGASGTGYYYWSTAVNRWINLVDNNPPGSPWFVAGNTGTTQPATPVTYGTSTIAATENFVGNTDAQDLVLGTNDIERMRIKQGAAGVGTNIGMGTATPDASATLDVSSTKKGLLIPRVTLQSTTDAATIASPATSLLVYNTTSAGSGSTAVSPGYYYNSGTPASPMWLKFSAGGGSSSFQYENRFQTNGTCGAGIYYLNSSNYGPGTYGDETYPYRNDQASGAYTTTTPGLVPAFYGVWYVSYTATATMAFNGYNGWVMIENNYNGAVNTALSGGAPFTITIYFYKYTPTAGNTGNIVGTPCGSGSATCSNTFAPSSITFSCAPVTLNPGDILIGYCTISGCPWVHSTSYYSLIDVMGAMQF